MGLFWRQRVQGPPTSPLLEMPEQNTTNNNSARSNQAGKLRFSWQVRLVSSAMLAGALGVSLWLGGMLIYYTIAFPDPLSVRSKDTAPVIRIVARDGTLLAKRGAAHDYVPIELVPQHVVDAVVATEDRRFFKHFGLDPFGLVRAAFANLRAGRFVQGGSTLTQQLAKNLFLTSERTLSRKLDELALAVWLEVRLTKTEILELYLNRVYFGAGAYGVEAASQRYFDKSVRALSVAEAALIAGLLKAPSKYAPTSNQEASMRRARSVLAKMRQAGVIDDVTFSEARRTPIRISTAKGSDAATGFEYAVDLVLERLPPILGTENAEMIVETTIDAALQRRANRIVANMLDGKGKTMQASQAALVSLDRGGGIRVLVGGRSYAQSQFNRAAKAHRQPGSVFKPFVYLTALERGMKPDSVMYDKPITIDGWSPQNDNQKHAGAITLRQALGRSVNSVAVQLARDSGITAVARTARRLGIVSELREDLSLALGTSELNLLEVVAAYGAFSEGGHLIEPHIIRRIRLNNGRLIYARGPSQQRRVISEQNVGAINDMLNAALVAGTGRRAALPRHPAAGKTGTTQDFRDAWFIGYTAHMTTGVWVGNDNGAPMRQVMGGNLPAEIWRSVMLDAHRDLDPTALPGTAPSDAISGRSVLPPLARSESVDMLSPLAPTMAPVPGRAVRSVQQWRRAARVAGSRQPRTIGQRLVIEPPQIPSDRPGGSVSGITAPLPRKQNVPKFPSERIDDEFLARMLQQSSTREKAMAGTSRNSGFDPDAIGQRIEAVRVGDTVPERARPPKGLMALGARN